MKIESIKAFELFDALGRPTVACTVILNNGIFATSMVPSGQSKGSFEAKELRDTDNKRLFGMGVGKAIENIQTIIAPALIGRPPAVVEMDLKMIELDGTEDKSYLGSNATLAVSIAILRAQAMAEELEVYELIAHLCDYERVTLPFGMFNLINGGMHAHNKLSIQEFMIMPVGIDSFRSSVEIVSEVFHQCAVLLKKSGRFFGIGDEGGYSVPFDHDREALDLIMQAIHDCGMQKQIVIALDVAATRLYDEKSKTYRLSGKQYTAHELIAYYDELRKQYPLYSIEDGLHESDWASWQEMTKQLGENLQIVGDDLFATNAARIAYGIEHQSANAVVIKPNQVGTVTETLQAIKLCKEYEMNVIVSHRSGETEDTFLVDLAVGTSAGQIKAGGLMRSERVSKYNALLQIEDALMGSLLDSY